jgi:hypothetical protein
MQYTDGMTTLYHSQKLQGFAALEKLGYTYDVVIEGSRRSPGISESKITSLTIYDPEGNDVTETLDYSIKTGKLQVYVYELNITTGSDSKVYDGTPLTSTEYTCSELITGHIFEYFNVTGSITNVGKVKNKVELKIVDGDGNDVTDTYKISCTYGDLEITPRDITVHSQSADKAYDGEALTCDEYYIDDATPLADGQTAVVEISGKQTSIGRSENTISSVRILDASGKDVTKNYNITTVNGTLRIYFKK